jgi:hypothetical protein
MMILLFRSFERFGWNGLGMTTRLARERKDYEYNG